MVKLRYLPLCPKPSASRPEAITKDTELVVLPSHGERIHHLIDGVSRCRARWPDNRVPMEIFNLITTFLSRDDVKSMRLVNKDFEEKVSANLFASAVVPFNTELYDMIEEDSKAAHRMPRPTPSAKAKGKAKAIDPTDQAVYKGHGLRVFQGFGPYFRRFGMSFEVAENQLARPPIKKELDHVTSYYGSYEWPHQQYTRFAGLAGLERTADETLRMKAAFSNLGRVQELGLSIDSGLGWLNGPDMSVHARVFQRPSSVFGPSRPTPDQQAQDAQTFWQALQETAPSTFTECSPPNVLHGLLYTTFGQPDSNSSAAYDKSALVPAELRKEQKEWLLETDWAQRAFLECYMLAVMDNPANFRNVKVLTIAKVSSGLLPILSREAFWQALPSVTDVTIHVKPDWRTVERDNAGFAETCPRHPSEAVNTFYRCMLRDRLCLKSTIKKLNLGWTAGGEHAEGIFARNNHILPAPISPLEQSTAVNDQSGLVFSFVEHLTLHNCWITPVTLERLVKNHADKALKTLTLDSVSMTAHPRFAAGTQAQQNQAEPSHWTKGHRGGSWAEVLDKVSPGPVFRDFLDQPQPWEEPSPTRPPTCLQAIEFKSCGYVKLVNNTSMDQATIEAGSEHHLSPWFRARQSALQPAMMTTNDRYIGRIVQHMAEHEGNALAFAWGLREGWHDRAKAEEVEYDGLLLGGTGRFSGKIEKVTSTAT
ncbi:hypothetical protein CERZMDRAFT_33755 [Cercospora zeae-maydis SCOH1-5]|uniref:F-box domain-containing protein n=1 Tax=Cercospora zeae-maydis SCOH1-5 TaxID=717836 RepID=A0A6A6FSL8_9PEZI|nr:hypothetical protein CERZMDRAFT_33755 [Cercospora zeae-maydis SCOH1-5]